MATNGAEGCISRTYRCGTTALLPAMVMIGLIAVSPGLRRSARRRSISGAMCNPFSRLTASAVTDRRSR